MKIPIPIHHFNRKTITKFFVVSLAIFGIDKTLFPKREVELPILSRNYCKLEAGKMSVKTVDIWESKVVKVMTKYLLL